MNGTIEIRCRQCGEVIGIVTDEIEPSTEAIIRETPVHCFFCHRLTLHRGEPVERRMPYRDECITKRKAEQCENMSQNQ